ncbi:hypothetical protein SAMN06269250_1711 [Spirosoma fluviale]|uniref:Uncharacterized protein n=1 Tax=Spirosoma fluviale TaxID=1597977 RepID=A0A286FDD2_9BACT|nr:hypothetical protein SAMN06269250_1711 [Spirosoma fluviale]
MKFLILFFNFLNIDAILFLLTNLTTLEKTFGFNGWLQKSYLENYIFKLINIFFQFNYS